MTTKQVLIVEDHPIIAQAYMKSLEVIAEDSDVYEFAIDHKSTIYDATVALNLKSYDLIFLDINLPIPEDRGMLSGEDLGLHIKEHFPSSKVIVCTTYNDNYRVDSIFRSINPEGFIIKSELLPEDLKGAILKVLDNDTYYSKTPKQVLRNNTVSQFTLDKIDRQLLYEISMGTRISDMPEKIPLSLSAIERRKKKLKEIFNIQQGDDKKLLAVAREKGFL